MLSAKCEMLRVKGTRRPALGQPSSWPEHVIGHVKMKVDQLDNDEEVSDYQPCEDVQIFRCKGQKPSVKCLNTLSRTLGLWCARCHPLSSHILLKVRRDLHIVSNDFRVTDEQGT